MMVCGTSEGACSILLAQEQERAASLCDGYIMKIYVF